MITVKDLSYTYPKGKEYAVQGVNFEIAKGEIFGFLGPSGAGKSTTQKILIKLLRNYEGNITVMGRELRTWGADYYERVGVSFELPNHYLKLTAMENLSYFASLYSGERADPRELMEMVGLGDSVDIPVGQFSKGMKGRLNFARSLLNKPDVLFLDEPTTGLDPVNARMIKNIVLRQREQGTTVFVTTHNMMVADELCDRVAFIVDGEIKLIDAPETLKVRHGERKVSVRYRTDDCVEDRTYALDKLGHNQDFIRTLQDYEIETIHTQETTLENIFIQVTGRELA